MKTASKILALFLSCLLLISTFCACRNKKETDAPTPDSSGQLSSGDNEQSSGNDSQKEPDGSSSDTLPNTPEMPGIPDESDKPQKPTSNRDAEKTLTAKIEGVEESFVGTIFCSELTGGETSTVYSLYYDSEAVSIAEYDSSDRFVWTLSDGAYMEIVFHPALSSRDVAPSLLDDYINFKEIEFSGEIKLNENDLTCYKLQADDGSDFCDAYIFDCDAGCLSAVIAYSESQAEEVPPRFIAMLETLEFEE